MPRPHCKDVSNKGLTKSIKAASILLQSLICFSGLPYDVTPEQALEHEEVRERINQSVIALQQATDKFLSAILKSPDKIP